MRVSALTALERRRTFGNAPEGDTMRDTAIRLAVVGGDVLFREALAAVLDWQPDFCVERSFAALDLALPWIRTNPVDVILLDIDNSRLSAAEATLSAELRRKLLVLSSGRKEQQCVSLVQTHYNRAFAKDQPVTVLLRQIRAIAACSCERKAEPNAAKQIAITAAPFTRRQIEVLEGVYQGHSNKEIAAELGISENTVKKFLQQMFDRTGIRTRSLLMRMAMEQSGAHPVAAYVQE